MSEGICGISVSDEVSWEYRTRHRSHRGSGRVVGFTDHGAVLISDGAGVLALEPRHIIREAPAEPPIAGELL